MSLFWYNKSDEQAKAHNGFARATECPGFETCIAKLAPDTVWNKLALSDKNVVICFKRRSCDFMISARDGANVNDDNERWESLFRQVTRENRQKDTTYSTIDTSASGTAPRVCYESLKELQQKKARDTIAMHLLCVVRLDHTVDAYDNGGVRVRWFNFNATHSDERIKKDLASFVAGQ
ncbi:hypothetical protein CYMTET_7900 [Cymbomonas tetramitiformis]|uniref:Uncharacterized protein n=1 Tax=Cymbomonas tetramitiformis TaxID=36881 RepID=A0AAE0GUR4_9CHLO|nr:hypothetical protein CYMTET_7900 [Cymbomonas tetramitiformis]|eukprot:gene28124-34806_t